MVAYSDTCKFDNYFTGIYVLKYLYLEKD